MDDRELATRLGRIEEGVTEIRETLAEMLGQEEDSEEEEHREEEKEEKKEKRRITPKKEK